MTVGELIEALKKQNPERRVIVAGARAWTLDVEYVIAQPDNENHDAPVEIWTMMVDSY